MATAHKSSQVFMEMEPIDAEAIRRILDRVARTMGKNLPENPTFFCSVNIVMDKSGTHKIGLVMQGGTSPREMASCMLRVSEHVMEKLLTAGVPDGVTVQ